LKWCKEELGETLQSKKKQLIAMQEKEPKQTLFIISKIEYLHHPGLLVIKYRLF